MTNATFLRRCSRRFDCSDDDIVPSYIQEVANTSSKVSQNFGWRILNQRTMIRVTDITIGDDDFAFENSKLLHINCNILFVIEFYS